MRSLALAVAAAASSEQTMSSYRGPTGIARGSGPFAVVGPVAAGTPVPGRGRSAS